MKKERKPKNKSNSVVVFLFRRYMRQNNQHKKSRGEEMAQSKRGDMRHSQRYPKIDEW
jgi:hypothetical protein